jgi:ADP-glucose pyrophosphorylase
MGGTCCKATLNPNMVHVKKINEIFNNCNRHTSIIYQSSSHRPKKLGNRHDVEESLHGEGRHRRASVS